MRKTLLLSMALLLALGGMTSAQEPIAGGRGTTLTITAELEFDFVSRVNVFDFDNHGRRYLASGNDYLGTYVDDTESFVDSEITINFKWDLQRNLTAFIQLENDRDWRSYVVCSSTGATTFRPLLRSDSAFGRDGFDLGVEQAYIEAREFFDERLTARVGIMDFAYSLRGDGTYFALNTSETANLGKRYMIMRNYPGTTSGFYYLEDLDGDGIGNECGGVWFKYVVDPETTLELFWFKALESFQENDDFDAMGAVLVHQRDLFHDLGISETPDERGKVLFEAINFRDDTGDSIYLRGGTGTDFTFTDILGINTAPVAVNGNFWLLGLGFDQFAKVEGGTLELYGEAIREIGTYSHFSAARGFSGQTDAETGIRRLNDLRQSAYACYVGGEFTFDTRHQPFVGASFWYLSGDDTPLDNNQESFITYGVIRKTLIVEDPLYGLGMNTNYRVWRLEFGMTPDWEWLDGEKVKFELGYNRFFINQDTIPSSASTTGRRIAKSGHFGDEVDFRVKWDYSENLSFTLGVGYFKPGDCIRFNQNFTPGSLYSARPFWKSPDNDPAWLLDFDVTLKF